MTSRHSSDIFYDINGDFHQDILDTMGSDLITLSGMGLPEKNWLVQSTRWCTQKPDGAVKFDGLHHLPCDGPVGGLVGGGGVWW